MTRILTFFAIALMAAAGTAQAVTADFDFRTAWRGQAETFEYTSGGATLTVGAGLARGFGIEDVGARVTRNTEGLGVRNSWFDRSLLDGAFGLDALTFSFDRTVTVEAIRFTYADRNDDAMIYVADAGGELEASRVIDIPRSGWLTTLPFDPLWTGDLFGIGATGWNDEFRIAGMRVSFGEAVSAVSGPGPLGLLLGGFGVLALSLARRRSAA